MYIRPTSNNKYGEILATLKKRDVETGETILKSRYYKKDKDGNVIENREGLFRRVADTVASAEEVLSEDERRMLSDEYYMMLSNYDFLPNSPTLMNAGMPLGQLSACFVLPVEDSIEDIFEAIKKTAIIHKSGGGTGFNFSHLRAKNSMVNSTNGVSSGPISFMSIFDKATEEIKQGGKRRGANMGLLDVSHPDILDFIECKDNKDLLNNFNISISISDKFMEALKNNESYDLIAPQSGEVVGSLDANMVFDKIVYQAWKNGEPGIVFMDTVNKSNVYGKMECTNPCGEQPLLPYEACNLGSINLANIVELITPTSNPNIMIPGPSINYDKLCEVTRLATRFLNDVIDINNYPTPEITEATNYTRKIGLGVMGFADMLIKLDIPYNSRAALDVAEMVMIIINDISHKESEKLGDEIGYAPVFTDNEFEKIPKRRNLYTTTIAPTGTISMIAGVSSGIEPLFAVSYFKQCLDGNKFMEVNPYFEALAKGLGFYSEELMKEVIEKGSLHDIESVPEDIKKLFATSHEISPEDHVKMQAVFQKYTDNAISKTINFNNDATEKDIKEAYLLAYELGCKGLTVYRNGSRDNQVLNLNSEVKEESKESPIIEPIEERKSRQPIMRGTTKESGIGCGKLYVTVNVDENGDPFEIFTTVGKGGGCPSQTEATSRLISIALQSGISPERIIKQLKGIKCPNTISKFNRPECNIGGTSCPDVISKTLRDVCEEAKLQNKVKSNIVTAFDCNNDALDKINSLIPQKNELLPGPYSNCPECGAKLRFESGCMTCPECYWSKCN